MKTEEILRNVPKVLLHDHLDGGLRTQTIIDLAKDLRYTKLPTSDPDELAEWFFRGANKGNLVEYLQGFDHTSAVMQTKEALERIAYEMMEDMKKDGVCYVETRFAPVFHTEKGLYYEDIINAVLEGLEKGKRDFGVGYGLILCGMRNMKNTLEIAELAVNFRRQGVVGFDLAGEEGGYPPKKHVDAFQFIKRENLVSLGDLAQYILDTRLPLEINLLSNVHTGAIDKLENHPFIKLYKEKYRVFLNTDDRLMSDTTLTKEYLTATDLFGLTLDDIEKLNINAMKSSFIPYKERLPYIYNIIKPGYQKMREKLLSLKV